MESTRWKERRMRIKIPAICGVECTFYGEVYERCYLYNKRIGVFGEKPKDKPDFCKAKTVVTNEEYDELLEAACGVTFSSYATVEAMGQLDDVCCRLTGVREVKCDI